MDRMALGFLVGTWSSCHPAILSDLSRDVPVLDSGFWVVERKALGRRARSVEMERERDPGVPSSVLLADLVMLVLLPMNDGPSLGVNLGSETSVANLHAAAQQRDATVG